MTFVTDISVNLNDGASVVIRQNTNDYKQIEFKIIKKERNGKRTMIHELFQTKLSYLQTCELMEALALSFPMAFRITRKGNKRTVEKVKPKRPIKLVNELMRDIDKIAKYSNRKTVTIGRRKKK